MIGEPKTGRRVGAGAVPLAGLALLALPWLPWLRSGATSRHSVAAFRLAQRLGMDGLDPLRVIWFLFPVMCLAVVLLSAVRRPGGAAVALMIAGVQAVGVGLAFLLSDLGTGVGPVAAVIGGGAAIGLGWVGGGWSVLRRAGA